MDLPVGENLRDHVATGLDLVTLNQSTPLAAATILNPLNAYNYFIKGSGKLRCWWCFLNILLFSLHIFVSKNILCISGPLTFPGCEVVGTAYSSDNKNNTESPPDIQIMALPGGLSSDAGVVLMKAMGISNKVKE